MWNDWYRIQLLDERQPQSPAVKLLDKSLLVGVVLVGSEKALQNA
jgi:hypothetical protein